MQTLEEAKAALEETEDENRELQEKLDDKDLLEVEPEIEPELEKDETEDTETEDETWLSGEPEKKFSDSDIGAAKKNLRARLEKKHQSEIDVLRQEIDTLKSGAPDEPTRDQFLDDADPDASYTRAVVKWNTDHVMAERDAKTQAATLQTKQEARNQKIEIDVDAHYNRAEKLIESHNISPETYKSSDYAVRSAVDQIYPGAGDGIVDMIISGLGEGSEKIIHSLGINQARRSEFLDRLRTDGTGFSAMAYVFDLKAKIPANKKSAAPTPAPILSGDAGDTASFKKLKSNYDKAVKSGNVQAMFDARKQARAAGAKDVNKW